MKPLCIYHGNCADGFGAAWAVRYRLGDIEFHAGVYQDPPPDVADRDVILVDFSYKRPVLEAMAKVANSVLVLDHHKSAQKDLEYYNVFAPAAKYADLPKYWITCDYDNRIKLAALFDMERSGAMIAWEFFNPGVRPPRLIEHIQDRDLWRFKLPGTREIQAALFSYPYDFSVWDKLMDNNELILLEAEGAAIERKHHKDVAELVAVCKRDLVIGGTVVPAASLPYTLTSDAGHLMAQDAPFAACYWDTLEGRVFSLRSRDDGMDVSEIAALYGGGGHKNAAGFRVPFSQLDEDGSPRLP